MEVARRGRVAMSSSGRPRESPVVDDDLHVALVMLDAKLVALDRVARVRIAVGAGEVEEAVVESASTWPRRSALYRRTDTVFFCKNISFSVSASDTESPAIRTLFP